MGFVFVSFAVAVDNSQLWLTFGSANGYYWKEDKQETPGLQNEKSNSGEGISKHRCPS